MTDTCEIFDTVFSFENGLPSDGRFFTLVALMSFWIFKKIYSLLKKESQDSPESSDDPTLTNDFHDYTTILVLQPKTNPGTVEDPNHLLNSSPTNFVADSGNKTSNSSQNTDEDSLNLIAKKSSNSCDVPSVDTLTISKNALAEDKCVSSRDNKCKESLNIISDEDKTVTLSTSEEDSVDTQGSSLTLVSSLRTTDEESSGVSSSFTGNSDDSFGDNISILECNNSEFLNVSQDFIKMGSLSLVSTLNSHNFQSSHNELADKENTLRQDVCMTYSNDLEAENTSPLLSSPNSESPGTSKTTLNVQESPNSKTFLLTSTPTNFGKNENLKSISSDCEMFTKFGVSYTLDSTISDSKVLDELEEVAPCVESDETKAEISQQGTESENEAKSLLVSELVKFPPKLFQSTPKTNLVLNLSENKSNNKNTHAKIAELKRKNLTEELIVNVCKSDSNRDTAVESSTVVEFPHKSLPENIFDGSKSEISAEDLTATTPIANPIKVLEPMIESDTLSCATKRLLTELENKSIPYDLSKLRKLEARIQQSASENELSSCNDSFSEGLSDCSNFHRVSPPTVPLEMIYNLLPISMKGY